VTEVSTVHDDVKYEGWLFWIGIFLQAWGGYVIWQLIAGHSVPPSGSFSYYASGVAAAVLCIGLLLLVYDALTVLANVFDGRDELEGSVLFCKPWFAPFFPEAVALIFLMAAGAIVALFISVTINTFWGLKRFFAGT
jgi:hypothetical protein